MDDFISVESARCDVSGSDPAPNPSALKCLDDGSRCGSILRGVADEYGGCADARLILATVLDHFQPPTDDCAASSRMLWVLATGPGWGQSAWTKDGLWPVVAPDLPDISDRYRAVDILLSG